MTVTLPVDPAPTGDPPRWQLNCARSAMGNEDVLAAVVVERLLGEPAVERFQPETGDVEEAEPFILGGPPQRAGRPGVELDVDPVVADGVPVHVGHGQSSSAPSCGAMTDPIQTSMCSSFSRRSRAAMTTPFECSGSFGTFRCRSKSRCSTMPCSSGRHIRRASCESRYAKGASLSGPSDRGEVARRWMRWATEDLVLAEHMAADEEVVSRGACIWAHQAAEKAIKALLTARDVDPPKLHDLDRLAARLPEADVSAFDDLDLPELTRWAIEGRYPTDLDEATSADSMRLSSSPGRCLRWCSDDSTAEHFHIEPLTVNVGGLVLDGIDEPSGDVGARLVDVAVGGSCDVVSGEAGPA